MSNALAVSDREYGTLVQKVVHLEEGMKNLRAEVKEVDSKVDSILSRFDKIDGGWRVLIFLGGIAGVVASILTTIAIKAWPLLIGTLPKV